MPPVQRATCNARGAAGHVRSDDHQAIRQATPRAALAIADDAQARFRRLFEDTERDLLSYAVRRVSRPEDAADVVAAAFAREQARLV